LLLIPATAAEAFDLSTNDGVGGLAQQDQLATVLLARHFQSLHVEQRLLAVSGAVGCPLCLLCLLYLLCLLCLRAGLAD
jgi:hypothetical protein